MARRRLTNPRGGLSAAGRRYYNRRGSNLRPPVKRAATPTQMRRKGSFLRRFYANPRGPLRTRTGRPTRLALAAQAWGERVPKTRTDTARLAAKGKRLLQRYRGMK